METIDVQTVPPPPTPEAPPKRKVGRPRKSSYSFQYVLQIEKRMQRLSQRQQQEHKQKQ